MGVPAVADLPARRRPGAGGVRRPARRARRRPAPPRTGSSSGGWYLPADDDAAAVLVASGNAGHRGHRAPLAEALRRGRAVGAALRLPRLRRQPGQSQRGRAGPRRAGRPRPSWSRTPTCRRSASSTSARASAPPWSPSWPPSTRRPGWSSGHRSSTSPRSPPCTTRSCRRGRCCVTGSRWPSRSPGSRCPTTVVYGSADSIVPPEQSRAVAEAAAGCTALVEVPGADHNDPVLLDGDAAGRRRRRAGDCGPR